MLGERVYGASDPSILNAGSLFSRCTRFRTYCRIDRGAEEADLDRSNRVRFIPRAADERDGIPIRIAYSGTAGSLEEFVSPARLGQSEVIELVVFPNESQPRVTPDHRGNMHLSEVRLVRGLHVTSEPIAPIRARDVA